MIWDYSPAAFRRRPQKSEQRANQPFRNCNNGKPHISRSLVVMLGQMDRQIPQLDIKFTEPNRGIHFFEKNENSSSVFPIASGIYFQ